MDPETARRRREHDKIRALKRMVKMGGKDVGRGECPTLPTPAAFVGEDVKDEIVDVNISLDVNAEDDREATLHH